MNSHFEILSKKIKSKDCYVCVIGLGYVGLPLLEQIHQSGFKTIGIDHDLSKISRLRERFSSLTDKIILTNDFSEITRSDILIICVPTPLNHSMEPDLSHIRNVFHLMKNYLKRGQLISLESTSYPFTTKEEIIDPLKLFGFKAGIDLFFSYSPERLDPGNKKFKIKSMPKIVAGETMHCKEVATDFYSQIVDHVVTVSSIETAEFTKILENTQRAVNVSLINELKIIADKMNIDIWEAIEAASTKPFGFTPYFPGPGSGGHCIPIDPFYLTFKAKQFGVHTRFVELAGQINNEMPSWILGKIIQSLSSQNKAIANSKILILGISYKKNIDDFRESPALKIINLLHQNSAKCFHYDEHFNDLHFSNTTRVEKLDQKSIESFDCIVIVTDHDGIDYNMILKHSVSIVDTRNVYKDRHLNVIRA